MGVYAIERSYPKVDVGQITDVDADADADAESDRRRRRRQRLGDNISSPGT